MEGSIVEILDHHAKETELMEGVTIEPVGSCATLVLKTILAENPSFSDFSCLRLLRKTILLDTVCLRYGVKKVMIISLFRPEAKRVTPKDVEMVEKAEALLDCGASDRQEVFDRVQAAKSQINHLTAGQLLRRDLKVTQDVF